MLHARALSWLSVSMPRPSVGGSARVHIWWNHMFPLKNVGDCVRVIVMCRLQQHFDFLQQEGNIPWRGSVGL